MPFPQIQVHGHRGARARFPENTIPAFEHAIEAGADYIELDVLATRDNVPVVCHDAVRNPAICAWSGGSDVVRELTLAELQRWDCGLRRHPEFPDQQCVPGARIPALAEVLALSSRAPVGFNIEIKSFPEHPEWAPPPGDLAELVIAEIRAARLEPRAIVQSFDFRALFAVQAIAPEIRTAALYEDPLLDIADISEQARTLIVAPEQGLVTPEGVQRAHAAGVSVIPWTANAPGDWERLLAAGVDGIITDDPAALIAFLRAGGQ